MQSVTLEEFNNLIADKKMLACSRLGAKVLENGDEIIKVFPAKKKKRLFYKPDIARFCNNAEILQQKDIKTVDITGQFHVNSSYIFYVTYKPVKGISLRDYLKQNPKDDQIMLRFADYLALLHNEGIYFRSIHFGNVIVQEDKTFALIDITTMYFKRKSLNIFLRARNFQIFSRKRYKQDFVFLQQHNMKLFLQRYLQQSYLSSFGKKAFFPWLFFSNPHYKKAMQ